MASATRTNTRKQQEATGGRSPDHEITRYEYGGEILRLAIWVNEVGENGGIAFSVKHSVRYRDQNGDWQTAKNHDGRHCLAFAAMYGEADRWQQEHRQQHYENG